MDKDNVERFLSAFNKIEEYLARELQSSGHVPFTAMLDHLSRRNPLVRQFYSELVQFARLRNIIVHTVRDGYCMATPHQLAVEQIESIAEQLSNPPIVADFMTEKPFFVRTDDTLARVVQEFQLRGFMRCPVLDDRGIVGLITAKSIARWFATAGYDAQEQYLSIRGALLQPVAQFLQYCAADEFAIVPRGFMLPDVLYLFQKSIERGKFLQSILVTVDGTARSPLVGIIAPSDLPKFYRLPNEQNDR